MSDGTDLTDAFAEAIIETLGKRGIRRSELARRLGVGRSSITSTLEHADNVTLRTVAEWGAALGLRFHLSCEEVAPDEGV